MILNESYTLSNGIQIPKLGLGTWFIDDDKAAQAVCQAAKLGYRLIDTAQAYGNKRGVGQGVRTCGIPREELFVASKVGAELKTYDAAALCSAPRAKAAQKPLCVLWKIRRAVRFFVVPFFWFTQTA